jgi:hypothetical protein
MKYVKICLLLVAFKFVKISAQNDTIRFSVNWDREAYDIGIFKAYIAIDSNVHLLDFKSDSSFLKILVPHREIHNFRFGVDSMLQENGVGEGDLDPINGMYWTWNSGYIQMKLEGKFIVDTITSKKFEYHIGGFRNGLNVSKTRSIRPVRGNNHTYRAQINLNQVLERFKHKGIYNIMSPQKDAVAFANILFEQIVWQ